MKQLNTFFIGVFIFILFGCDRGSIRSDQVAADQYGNNNIHRKYRVDFKEETNQTMASATYSVGGAWGTTLQLISPSAVRVNGVAPVESTDEFDNEETAAFFLGFLFPPAWFLAGASGTTYHKNFYGNPGIVDFEFLDSSLTGFHDSIRVPKLSLRLPSYANRDGFSLSVFGLDEGSRVYVRLEQGRQFKSLSTRGQSLRVTADDLINFYPGPIEVKVEVSNSLKIKKDARSLGGRISMSYSFSPRIIEFR